MSPEQIASLFPENPKKCVYHFEGNWSNFKKVNQQLDPNKNCDNFEPDQHTSLVMGGATMAFLTIVFTFLAFDLRRQRWVEKNLHC